MSKTKRSGDRARIAALEKDLRRLRAQLPKEITHRARAEAQAALHNHEAETWHVRTYTPETSASITYTLPVREATA